MKTLVKFISLQFRDSALGLKCQPLPQHPLVGLITQVMGPSWPWKTKGAQVKEPGFSPCLSL